MKQEADSRRRVLLARSAMFTARTMLAVMLPLILVAGSIVWPAAASGSLCAMACCSGKAPHAAGSCMHGTCETGVATKTATTQHSHGHHAQQQQTATPDNSIPRAFAGAMASAVGSDLDQVPTIDATSSRGTIESGAQADASETGNATTTFSATILTAPCQPGCSAGAAGFSKPGRSRNTAALAGSPKSQLPTATKLAHYKFSLNHSLSTCYRQTVPRGPPQFAS